MSAPDRHRLVDFPHTLTGRANLKRGRICFRGSACRGRSCSLSYVFIAATAGPTNDHHERMLADFARQLAKRALRMFGAAATEEESRVFFTECIKAAIRTYL